MMLWMPSMPTADSSAGRWSSGLAMALTMVCSTWPSSNSKAIARAKPIRIAVPASSAEPLLKATAMARGTDVNRAQGGRRSALSSL
ncbi:MAG: hypothetical protein R6U98_14215 [Pirellulaceae bacterium]